jgi:hypothetical protein
MILKLISCEIFYREMCAAVAHSPHRIDIEFLPKGLHDLPPGEMPARVQAAIDAVPEGNYDAILLGYGLCNNGLSGIIARHVPLILPRAHDCITLFLGSRQRYKDYFDSHPGTYFLTSGWLERGDYSGDLSDLSVQKQLGMNMSMEELIEQYGEENAEYLYETLCNGTKNYGRFAWIPMGVEPAGMENDARQKAQERAWEFETISGDMTLINQLVNGDWNEENFLRVPPGSAIKACHNHSIVSLNSESPPNPTLHSSSPPLQRIIV